MPRVSGAFRALRGGEIGEDIGAAKAEDRLLGIADQEEPARRAEDPLEDRVLQRIGILKLVDQRRGILRADALAQRLAAGGFQLGRRAA